MRDFAKHGDLIFPLEPVAIREINVKVTVTNAFLITPMTKDVWTGVQNC